MVKWIKEWLAKLDEKAQLHGAYNEYLMQHAGVVA
jgi:hypothetical protein